MKGRSWILGALLALLPGVAFGQSQPVDDAGNRSPFCTWLDQSVTPAAVRFCNKAFPLPGGGAPTPGGGFGVDLGTGAAYFGGQTGPTSVLGQIPQVSLFTPAGLIGFHASAGGFVFYASSDGGVTWTPGATPASFVTNGPGQLALTTSTTPRYLIAATGDVTSSVFHAPAPTAPWTRSTGLPGNVATGIAVQGSQVLAVGSNAAATLTQACLSTNDGQTFGGCVTVDPAAASIPNFLRVPFVATPGPNVWLVVLNNGKVWRSADNGATWTNVFTGGASGTITCLTTTRCVVSNGSNIAVSVDAGLTWTPTQVLSPINAVLTVCPYDAVTMTAIMTSPWPTTNGGVTQAAFKTNDGGVTWTPVNTTAGPAMVAGANTLAGPCTVSGARASFVIANGGTIWAWFGGTSGNGVIQQQSATRLDASGLGVTATGAAGAAVTATLPLVGGSYHYIALVEIRQYATAALVGGAAPVLVTSTNLPGADAWTFSTALAIGTSEGQQFTPATPYKSTVPGTATTIVAPATVGVIWRIRVWYYAAP